MKYKLNKKEFEALSEDMQKLYVAKGDDYVLQVEGLPESKKDDDSSGLVAKNKELLDELKQFKGKAREQEEAARKAAEEAAKKSGDIDALEKSWQEKLDKANADSQAANEKLQASLNGLLVDNVAQKLASEIGLQGSESILIPHIKQRLAAEERDGQHRTVVRDLEGKASALTLEELKNEFINNPAFAPVIVGSKANGGGATNGQGGAAHTSNTPKSLEDCKTDEDKINYVNSIGE